MNQQEIEKLERAWIAATSNKDKADLFEEIPRLIGHIAGQDITIKSLRYRLNCLQEMLRKESEANLNLQNELEISRRPNCG